MPQRELVRRFVKCAQLSGRWIGTKEIKITTGKIYMAEKKLCHEAKEYVFNYLSTHPCSLCGESDPVVLEFHHTGEKEDSVSKLLHQSDSLIRVLEEISGVLWYAATATNV